MGDGLRLPVKVNDIRHAVLQRPGGLHIDFTKAREEIKPEGTASGLS
jgi:hypothetical protein